MSEILQNFIILTQKVLFKGRGAQREKWDNCMQFTAANCLLQCTGYASVNFQKVFRGEGEAVIAVKDLCDTSEN